MTDAYCIDADAFPDGGLTRAFDGAPVISVGQPASGSANGRLQAAIGVPSRSLDRRIVDLGAGTFDVSDVTITSGTWLRGRGRDKTVLRRGAALVTGILRFADGAGDIVISDMTFDGDNAADRSSLVAMGAHGSRITFLRCRFRNGCQRWALLGAPLERFEHFYVLDCEFENLPSGGIILMAASMAVRGSSDLRVVSCSFERVGNNLCQFHDYEQGIGTFDRRAFWLHVMFNANTINNCLTSGKFGAIPVEIWAARYFQQIGNVITSGTRGLTAGAGCEDVIIACNRISNQTAYAMEGGRSRRVRIHGNTITNCATFYKDTSGGASDGKLRFSPSMARVDDVEIFDNVIRGSGLSAFQSADVISLGCDGATVPAGVRIHDNTFEDVENVRSLIRFAGQETHPGTVFSEHEAGKGRAASLDFTYKATAGRVLDGGSGYTRPPAIRIESADGNGSGASATCTIGADGQIDGVRITEAGHGYTVAPKVIVSGGGGRDGEVEILLGIATIEVLDGGTGYASGTFKITGFGGAGATGLYEAQGGAVVSCTPSTAGQGYGRASDIISENNRYTAKTYASTIGFYGGMVGRVESRGNTWTRHAPFDRAHPSAGAPFVFPIVGSQYRQGNPHYLSSGDSAQMLGPVGDARLIACGRSEAQIPRFGCRYSGFRATGHFAPDPFVFADSGGATVLEGFQVDGLALDEGHLRGNVNAACILGLATGAFLIVPGAFVNLASISQHANVRLVCVNSQGRRTICIRRRSGGARASQATFRVEWHAGEDAGALKQGQAIASYGAARASAPQVTQTGNERLHALSSVADAKGQIDTNFILPPGRISAVVSIEATLPAGSDWGDYDVKVT